jgi:two-component system LytT family response regulator
MENNAPITAILVDDEPHALQALERQLAEFSQIVILARCENGLQVIKAVQELSPQVIFLDIQMPKLDGFDVLELLGECAPAIVFVTAHDDYAVRAFDENALDYLLKPVSAERLRKTIDRIAEKIVHPPAAPTSATELLLEAHRRRQAPLSRILVREKGEVNVIPCQDILAIEAADDYVVLHTEHGVHIKQERLNRLESLLDPSQFCRIHRSTIINLDYLEGITTEGKDSRFANLKKQKQFAISRSGYERLINLL